VARELGIAPGEAVFVDDMLSNVVRAESRGMRGIVFEDEEQFRAELKGCLATEDTEKTS
jgi:putative hydrolase of the HAD superfamily